MNKLIKITVERDDSEKLELTTCWDAGLEEWEQTFRVILKWLTFTDESVKDWYGHDEFGEKLTEEE